MFSRIMLALSLAGLLSVGAGCGAPSCEDLAKKMMSLAGDATKDMPEEEKKEKTAEWVKECKEENPSKACRKCIMGLGKIEDMDKCEKSCEEKK